MRLRDRLHALAEQRRRFGYRRFAILPRREGHAVNAERVYRLYGEEGLAVRRRRRKRLPRLVVLRRPPARAGPGLRAAGQLRGLALSGDRLDNRHGSPPMARSLADLHEETLVQEETFVGEAGNDDQRGDCARSPEASPGGCHAPAARGRSAPKEGNGSSSNGHDPAPECGGLEAPHGGCSRHPAGVRGGREGRNLSIGMRQGVHEISVGTPPPALGSRVG